MEYANMPPYISSNYNAEGSTTKIHCGKFRIHPVDVEEAEEILFSAKQLPDMTPQQLYQVHYEKMALLS